MFHECCHGSFFATPQLNKIFMQILSCDVITPAQEFKSTHLWHHSISGNSDLFDTSNTIPFTKQQYQKFSKLYRILFRIFRDPIMFFFFVFPALHWWIEFPLKNPTIPIYIGHAIKFYLYYTVSPYLLVSMYFAALLGLALFHLQHGANDSYRATTKEFSKDEGAILGSTYITIPWPISIFSLGIEFHHIHHLNTRVPCYMLSKCHFDAEHLWDGLLTKITAENIWESLNVVLWDEETDKLIPFSKS